MARRKLDFTGLKPVPPTKKQVQDILFSLRQGTFLEHACLLAGVPLRMLNIWITLGRKNEPGFVEFTDAVDRANAELGNKLSTALMTAIENGDMSSLRWLYDKRLAQAEKHAQQKWLAEADEIESATNAEEYAAPESLADAEKRLEESLLAETDGELH